MKTTLTLLTALLLAPLAALHAADASTAVKTARFFVSDLKTDYRQNPLGLETRHLRFFWRVSAGKQRAWRAQAASSPDKLAAGKADLWDSSRRDGGETTQIAYEGCGLRNRPAISPPRSGC